MDVVKSVNNVPIRLTDERWIHIVENHDDLAGYYDEILGIVESPDCVIKGYEVACIALKQVNAAKYLAVVYKEISNNDGFIISEVILWQQQK